MHDRDKWYHLNNPEQLDTPALVVFPDRVRKNIRTAIDMVRNVHFLRPHVKTNKSPDACKMMMEEGITKFKCATIAEAEMLGMIGAPDVLLAYQPLGPKAERLAEVIRHYPETQYSCLTDNVQAAKEQSNIFDSHNLQVPVFIDLNVGMNRTGIVPGDEAVTLCKQIHLLPGIVLRGVHAYDGHFRDADFSVRKQKCDEAFLLVEKMLDRLEEEGFKDLIVVAGGSPTFSIHSQRDKVECSPGTFIYWDKGYGDLCAEQPFLSAAVLVTRVISFPSEDRVTTDLGHKSVAAENEIGKRVYFQNVNGLKPVGQSEEHLVLERTEHHEMQVGQVLYGIPYHICPTVALFERVFTVQEGKVNGEWKTIARDRKIHF